MSQQNENLIAQLTAQALADVPDVPDTFVIENLETGDQTPGTLSETIEKLRMLTGAELGDVVITNYSQDLNPVNVQQFLKNVERGIYG